jgi:hypothetical protein
MKVGNKFDKDKTLICAIIKVQSNKEVHLTDDEASILKPWKLSGAENGVGMRMKNWILINQPSWHWNK